MIASRQFQKGIWVGAGEAFLDMRWRERLEIEGGCAWVNEIQIPTVYADKLSLARVKLARLIDLEVCLKE